ncbi:hypothetical protein [Rhodohalobacter sulfatireducens]|uniref:VCBS repeat-containing protein n=1 Tax=Rhodohalobacter sulfatireducens TaxID=2911366 RepID=A0ABS9KC15_9BACT|nr:hypothetical protein [Rhodohalobacter sulfatireducens]MCG2588392.1 hypothetical protein [Rhodohalobacter sulfatireducens]
MARKKRLTLLSLFVALLITSCTQPTTEHWSEFVPESTFVVMVPGTDGTINQVLAEPFAPLMDDITPSAMQLITNIQEHTDQQIPVEALLLHPSSSNNWQPVWITRTVNGLPESLAGIYQESYQQNQYDFKGFTIEKLFFDERILFMVSFEQWTLFSQSSFSIESVIRTLSGAEAVMPLQDNQLSPGAIIMNTESMDEWVQQVSQVLFRPFLKDIFAGSSPISFRPLQADTEEFQWQLQGAMELQDSTSSLVRYITQPATGFSLDRYIPVNAAAFSIFRVDQQVLQTAEESFQSELELDQYLQSTPRDWHTIQQNIGDEVAFVSFANSGPSSESEYLFLRTIQDSSSVRSALDRLAEQEIVIKDEATYFVNSYLLGKLFGSDIFPIDDFYITVYEDVAAIAQRKGLAESIGGDATRRRVIYYDNGYATIRNSLPNPLSSIHYINAADFGTYIQPWLFPQNYIGTILGNLDEFVISTRLEPGTNTVDVRLTSFEQETESSPYTDQWVFPLNGAEISGEPVLADITGGPSNEVIFSTENGYIYALAMDGTAILQASTENDVPIGAPVVFDWYGNNQNIIMQAAGNKVYAWNQSGTILPNFPIRLDEDISTPLTITDITGNGIAEIIVATADRNMHILNARGQSIQGWPQSTNSVVESSPLIAEINNQKSMFAYSENTLHAWNVNGELRENYPVFLTSQVQGSPYNYNNTILGSGLNGNVYSIGLSPFFSDSLSNLVSSDSLIIQTLQVTNSSLNSTPSHFETTIPTEEGGLVQRNLILLQATNGSLFLYDETGQLQFTQSMGQPSSATTPPLIQDLDGDQREDLIALADFGRLYAWDILSGERHSELPTAGMSYPVISDFLGNGRQEIIARTREGLQCWTINFTERISSE